MNQERLKFCILSVQNAYTLLFLRGLFGWNPKPTEKPLNHSILP